jgi:hypothetical protein
VTDEVWGGGGQYSLAALRIETLDLARDGVLEVKFSPLDVLSWPPLVWMVGIAEYGDKAFDLRYVSSDNMGSWVWEIVRS